MKKLFLILGAGLLLAGCSSGVPQSQYESVVTERDSYKKQLNEFIKDSNDTSIESQQDKKESATYTEKTDLENNMEITEYSYENTIGDTLHFYIVKNASDKTVKISFNTTALDSSGEIIGANTSELSALGSGCTSCVVDYYNGVTDVNQYKYTLSVKEDKNYKSVINDIAIDISQQPDKAIVTCTNNGDSSAEFLEAIALFFKDDKLIRNSTTYIIDDDSELKPGATLSAQLDCYEQYDEVKVYLTGRSNIK